MLFLMLFGCVQTGVSKDPEANAPRDVEAGAPAEPDPGPSTDTGLGGDLGGATGAGSDTDTGDDEEPAPEPQDTLSASLDAVFADLDVSPDGERLYATRVFHEDLVVVSTSDLSLLATIPLGGPVSALRIAKDGRHALVGINSQPGRTLVLDTDPSSGTYHSVVGSLTLGGQGSLGVAVHPDGMRAAAMSQRPDPGEIFLLSFPGLSRYGTVSPAASGPAPILNDVRFAPDGTLGYASISQSGPGNDLVSFDPDAGVLSATIDLGLPHEGGGADRLAVVEVDGDVRVWITNSSWETAGLTVLDARTETVAAHLDQGETGSGDVCALRDGRQVLYVAPRVPIRAFDTTSLALTHTRPERDDHIHCVVSVDDAFVFISTVSGDLLKVDLRNLASLEPG
ncbi:MAG: hypothetical protein VX000_11645 [Myxococcota bacterium]|nr:hypothetical protein [Myxococcota bacterium]